jgi:hypothetical protein
VATGEVAAVVDEVDEVEVSAEVVQETVARAQPEKAAIWAVVVEVAVWAAWCLLSKLVEVGQYLLSFQSKRGAWPSQHRLRQRWAPSARSRIRTPSDAFQELRCSNCTLSN